MIDTREQLPYTFEGLPSVVAKLDAGDYSLVGHEHRVAVERKTKEDMYGCIGAGRKRFTVCLERLAVMESACIVIECSLAQFAVPPTRTRIDARMAVGSVISWSCMYRLPVFWAGSRDYGERVTLRWLCAYLKHRARVQDS